MAGRQIDLAKSLAHVENGGIPLRAEERLAEEAASRGLWKLVGKVFPENLPCVRMVGRCGFREVGLHRCHGRLDGRWRDVLLVERLLGEAHRIAADAQAAVAQRSGSSARAVRPPTLDLNFSTTS